MNGPGVIGRRLPALAAAALALLLGTAAAHAQYVVWLDTEYGSPVLRRGSETFTDVVALPLPGGSLPEGLAMATATGRLVWAESAWSGAAIRGGPLTLASSAELVGGLSCARGIAEDPATGRIYWTTSNLVTGSGVHRCESDGAGATTLLSFGSSRNLRGIAVDPAAGRMYFTDFDNSQILAANLDGSGLAALVTLVGGSSPYGIALDQGAGRLYWCEYGSGRIRRSSTTGADVTVLYSEVSNPTYLALDPPGDALYWSDAGGVPRMRKARMSGGPITTVEYPMSTYGGVAFVSADVVGIPEPEAVRELALAPIAPNPAHGRASVSFALPADAQVRVTLMDLQGRRVATLVDGVRGAGRHTVDLAAGRASGPGLYFVRMESGGRTFTRRVTLLP